jgi:hypothetical protein
MDVFKRGQTKTCRDRCDAAPLFGKISMSRRSLLREVEGYFDSWFSPRRFKRSRNLRCNTVGVLGLNATRYHSG